MLLSSLSGIQLNGQYRGMHVFKLHLSSGYVNITKQGVFIMKVQALEHIYT